MDGHPTRFLIVMLVDLLASEFHPGYCYICQLQLANSHHKMATLLIPRSYPSTIPESIRTWGFTAPSSGDGPISPAFCAHLMRGMWDSGEPTHAPDVSTFPEEEMAFAFDP